MTDEELTSTVHSINEGITAIADRLQAVIANYDKRIIEAEKRLMDLEGNCRYRGMEKIHQQGENVKRIENIERKINFLIISNVFAFCLFALITLVIFNPEFHEVFMHILSTVTP